MKDNLPEDPYAPPSTVTGMPTSTPNADPPGVALPRRPPVVWLTQGITVFLLLVVAFVTLNRLVRTPHRVFAAGPILITGASLLLLIAAFLGMQRRRPYGRWLGVLVLGIFLAQSLITPRSRLLYSFLLGDRSAAERLANFGYSSLTQLQTAAGTNLCLNATVLAALLYLVLSPKMSAYFQNRGPIPRNRPASP